MWGPLAETLVKDHTVIVPDLRGLGLSSKPEGGYDKKTQAEDVANVLDAFGVSQADLVTHDIGNMVAFAFATARPDRVRSWAPIDAPLPGVGRGIRSLRTRRCGSSGLAVGIWSGSSPAASGFTWTVSGMTFPKTRRGSTRQSAGTTQRSTLGQAPSARGSPSSQPSVRTPSTARRSWSMESFQFRSWLLAARRRSAR
ncbi:alpha/beta hydrolase [Caulobacter sp. S45]|uniref:alpha/beta hydrolase n=1 Tax=Caulobacter sp. S45 TaxID=1641861 RepID=UPI00352AC5D4